MHHHRFATAAKTLLVLVVVAVFMLPLLTGCNLIDQLLGRGISGGGTGNALQERLQQDSMIIGIPR